MLDVEEHIKIPDSHRVTHVLTAGPTGYGKTQELVHVALQDAYKGHGLCIINPKGGMIDEFLGKLPRHRRDDLVYINPAQDSVPSINVLEPYTNGEMTLAQQENQKEIIVSDLVDLFKRQSENWGDQFGRVFETLLHAYLNLNMRTGDAYTLVDVYRAVVNQDALTDLIDRTQDPVIREQLVKVKENMTSYELEPLQRRLNDFVMNAAIRRVIQGGNGLDFRDILDQNRILLVDVQKGEVGATVSELVGSIVITKVWAAAQSRITQPETERTPFYLFVDELQNFAGEGSNFAKILSEAREYRLGLWLATQYLHQLDTELRRAITNNTRTKLFFNPADSEDVHRITGMLIGIEKQTLGQLGKYRAAVQMDRERTKEDAVIIDTYPPYVPVRPQDEVEEFKQAATPATNSAEHAVEQRVGDTAAAGGEAHRQLLHEAKRFLEFEEDAQVNLLYQDGSEKPDGHIIGDDRMMHLEAEHATLSKPEKVLTNLERAHSEGRRCVFIVHEEDVDRLDTILEDVDSDRYHILVSTDLGVMRA
jgi:RecA/RadA recombinase